MKTIVLTFSRQFPAYHPEAGKDTNFVESILNGKKQTTIRGNLQRWRIIRSQLKKGTHILSLRYWSGKPYRSKQVEFARCTSIDTHRVFITNDDHNGFEMSVNSIYRNQSVIEQIAAHEGLTVDDFTAWFPQEEFSGAMIEFLNIEKG